jgi:hypothetical protein
MNDQPGPSGGTVLAAVFMIVAGLCLALLGGGCTIVILTEFANMAGGGAQVVPLLLISMVILAGGLGMIWIAVKLLRGGFNRP